MEPEMKTTSRKSALDGEGDKPTCPLANMKCSVSQPEIRAQVTDAGKPHIQPLKITAG
ncbi:MAG: hypothetical protein NVSMB62_12230 [Acidobacteriaceae bacterium]